MAVNKKRTNKSTEFRELTYILDGRILERNALRKLRIRCSFSL